MSASPSSEHSGNQFALLRERRFGPFFLTQFLGALNDNVFKQALVTLATFHAARLSSLPADVLVPLAGGVFILPFFLFSATAGQIADKFEKTRLIRIVKAAEIVIMLIGGAGFVLSNLVLLLCALFLMGVHSTVFGPVKYAILPQHLAEHELVGGNAWVESGTFLAILIGTIAGGLLGGGAGSELWVAATTVAIAVLLIGGFGFEVWRRKFKRVWDDGEERIAEAIKKAEAAIV